MNTSAIRLPRKRLWAILFTDDGTLSRWFTVYTVIISNSRLNIQITRDIEKIICEYDFTLLALKYTAAINITIIMQQICAFIIRIIPPANTENIIFPIIFILIRKLSSVYIHFFGFIHSFQGFYYHIYIFTIEIMVL